MLSSPFFHRVRVIRVKHKARRDAPNHHSRCRYPSGTRKQAIVGIRSFDLSPLVPSSRTRITQPFRPWDPLARYSLAASVSGPTLSLPSSCNVIPITFAASSSSASRCSSSSLSLSQSRSTKTHLRKLICRCYYIISHRHFGNIVRYENHVYILYKLLYILHKLHYTLMDPHSISFSVIQIIEVRLSALFLSIRNSDFL